MLRLLSEFRNNKVIHAHYTSLSSGNSERELVPHSIVDNGLRWHLRAYDRKSKSYRDFVLTRINKVVLGKSAEEYEGAENDHDWQRFIPLQLVPHPHNIKHNSAIESDYGMQNGLLTIEVRVAMAGYLLRRWNVDCTENADLSGPEYQLWLRNRITLVDTPNLAIAPGYQNFDEATD